MLILKARGVHNCVQYLSGLFNIFRRLPLMNCPQKLDSKKVPKITLVIFGIIFYTNQQQKGKKMKYHIFTLEEKSELETNPNIIKVMNSNVEYTEAFKQRVLHEHEEFYKSAKQIFAEAGIPDWLNKGKYAKNTLQRWIYQQRHPKEKARCRPKTEVSKPVSEMSTEELRKEILYLRLENEFLKKLEPLEQYKDKN